ncbi:dihydrofolate reductase family protein [Paenarthrobacter sp. Z7-10]|uniref:dihydrofolate reductase family protein n=1 Tax=Paenarthrobacter sp. Z7-10 TaxID=2787635 RepID=UPI0022A95B25|nr:dihydrofolate reductase family protein [Paenarthrobacter sp. Z7-10]MCZ2402975.1 dihydrofolate reductase family protein [Paenarthrobacter sp. Z7-10]
MAKLIYSGITSLDGYVADVDGSFDWCAPDEDVHAFINELERPVGTYLFGRRMYEVKVAWEDLYAEEGEASVGQDFAGIWHAADKVVYSTTLASARSAKTRIEREFDPNLVHRMKTTAERDISIGGPTLAAQAFTAGLIDEVGQFLTPLMVGGGLRFFPPDARLQLELLDERRFRNGVVYLKYGVVS